MLGLPVEKPNKNEFDLDYVGIKASQFSFNRLQKADPVLGVDMASTGEVGCIGDDVFRGCFEKYAFRRSPYPRKEYSALDGYAKTESGHVGCRQDVGIERLQPLCNRRDTPLSRRKRHLQYAGLLPSEEDMEPQALTMLHERKIDMVVNIPRDLSAGELNNGYKIRRAAIDLNVPLITNARLASAFIEAFCTLGMDDIQNPKLAGV